MVNSVPTMDPSANPNQIFGQLQQDLNQIGQELKSLMAQILAVKEKLKEALEDGDMSAMSQIGASLDSNDPDTSKLMQGFAAQIHS